MGSPWYGTGTGRTGDKRWGGRANLRCKNTVDASWALIENQLKATDHRHVGQLLTYAAGLDAHTVIWIAKTFRHEYRAMLDWQNRITDEREVRTFI